MKMKIALLLIIALVIGTLAGCTGTPVIYYTECDCPDGAHANQPEAAPSNPAPQTPVVSDGTALKTGLYIGTNVADSVSADGETAGTAAYDLTIAAVTVDDNGVIASCIIDSVPAKVTFDASGAITSDISAEVLTKNELKEAYNMKLYGGAKYEWYEQAAALSAYAVGKTVDELKNGAVGETGYAVDVDLASTATIYLGGYVSAIEAAVSNAQHLGAVQGDTLRLAISSSVDGSAAATAEKAGTAQLDTTVAVLTEKDGVITSCYIDAVQAKVSFDAKGIITTDLSAPIATKNELKEAYNMKLYGGAKYEWYEQAASFAAYVTGKTLDEVNGIAVNEATKPTDVDLAATVTISIGDFQALIAKALQG